MVLNPLGCAEDGYGKNSLPHAIEKKPVQRLWFRAETVALTSASASTGQADEQNENESVYFWREFASHSTSGINWDLHWNPLTTN